MKIQPKSTSGNVLFATLFTTGILSLFLGGYLNLVRSENQATFRSQTWNAAIPIAEAGIEEALTHLIKTYSSSLAQNGWELKYGKYYYKTNALNSDEYYKVGIFPPSHINGPTPVIVSQGFSRVPGQTNFISRTVQVNTKLDGPPMDGMIVVTTADLNGNKISIDSFNSTTNTLSTNGKYDVTKRSDKVILATLSGADGALDIGNAEVFGKIGSAYNGVKPTIGAQGSVGNLQWHADRNKGLQDGAFIGDINIAVQKPVAPYYSGNPLPTGLTRNSYILGSSDYAVDNLGKAKITVIGKARLLVTKSLSIESIDILPGGSLELYVAADSADIAGSPNVNGNAANLKYYGLSADPSRNWAGNKTLSAGGNGEFTAMIFAPETTLTLKGSGDSVSDLSGAVIVKKVIMTGHYNFHFDEAIAEAMANRYTPISWDELSTSWDWDDSTSWDTILAQKYNAAHLY